MPSLPVLQAIEHFGLKADVQNGQANMRCPFHDEQTASFDIRLDTGMWNCFGCGAHGGFVDFLARLDGGSHLKALKLMNKLRRKPAPALEDLADMETYARMRRGEEPDVAAQWSGFHMVNWQKLTMKHPAAAYLIDERKFTRATLEAFDVRLTEWLDYPIVIPWRRGDDLIGYVYRLIEPKSGLKKYKFNVGFSAETAIAYYKQGNEPLMICEGILDYMKAAQFGYSHAACIPSWRLSEAHAMWLRAQGIKEFICAVDNTPTGEEGFERMKKMLPVVYRFGFPGKYRKDIGELGVNEFMKGVLDAKGV